VTQFVQELLEALLHTQFLHSCAVF
jgi:hypothetical protein